MKMLILLVCDVLTSLRPAFSVAVEGLTGARVRWQSVLREAFDAMDRFWIGQGLDATELRSIRWRYGAYVLTWGILLIGVVPLVGITVNALGSSGDPLPSHSSMIA